MKKFKLKFILLLLALTFIIGNISALSTSDALTVPKVKNLSTASRTSTSIKLKWSKVSSSSGYESLQKFFRKEPIYQTRKI